MLCRHGARAYCWIAPADTSGSECVITRDYVITAMGNIYTGGVVLDVGPSEPFEPEVERFVAAIEAA